MGQNQYGSWDDKAMAKVEAKFQRAKRKISERYTKKHNDLIDKIEQCRRDERKAYDAAHSEWQDESDALVKDHRDAK